MTTQNYRPHRFVADGPAIPKKSFRETLKMLSDMSKQSLAGYMSRLRLRRDILAQKCLRAEGPPFQILRWRLFLQQARRDADLTTRVSKEFAVPTLNIYEGLRKNSAASRNLYILAGGASINRISESQWSEIRNGVSIGINFWPIHQFCPDFLSTELDKSSRSASSATRFLEAQISRNYKERPPGILVLRPNWPPQREMLYNLPSNFKTMVYGRANLVGNNRNNLDQDLSRIVKSVVRRTIPREVLPDNGSSVVRLILLGVAQGFDKIVLVGVDQNDGPYFWTEQPIPGKYALAARLFPRSTGMPHSTSSVNDRPHPNEIFLPALSRAIEQNSLSQVFVANEYSRLFPDIPKFKWTERTEP